MFLVAGLIGIYSHILFLIGVSGFLYKESVIFSFLIFLLSILIITFKFRNKIIFRKFSISKSKLSLLIIILILFQLIVNFIGVLGPEISFDALWYHLTLPKIFLIEHKIFHIPGSLLYYSDMPKLTEMLYLPGLVFGIDTFAKFIHFIFGVLILLNIYKLSRNYMSTKISLLACIVFYSNLVVGWESITAYIDLARTFFELLSFTGFLIWYQKRKVRWLAISAVMLGFAISTKIIALESLLIFLMLLGYLLIVKKQSIIDYLKNSFIFIFFSLLIPTPWFIFSYLNTKNIFYPFFDSRFNLGTNFMLPNLIDLPKDFINLFIYSNDPISPIYLIVVPLAIVLFFKVKLEIKLMYIYVAASLLFWYFTPKIGGGRFILVYLPVFSVLLAYIVNLFKDIKIKNFLIILIIFISFISIGYRLTANKKYLPLIFGKESNSQFLQKNLNFEFGDFYDTDDYFKNNLKQSDVVLLYGFHNLYYVNFNFIDSSWVKRGDLFNYIAVQNSVLPDRFKNWKEIYYNPITKVKLYSLEGKKWEY